MPRYYEWDEDNEIVTEYKRHGSCNACGDCCRALVSFKVAGEYEDNDSKNGGSTTDGKGKWAEVFDGERTFFRVYNQELGKNVCSSLIDNLCEVHNTNKPGVCKKWPFSPRDIEPYENCGYRFEFVGQWNYDELEESE